MWKGELLTMVLAPAAEQASELPDLSKSIGYVVGTSCEFEILPLYNQAHLR